MFLFFFFLSLSSTSVTTLLPMNIITLCWKKCESWSHVDFIFRSNGRDHYYLLKLWKAVETAATSILRCKFPLTTWSRCKVQMLKFKPPIFKQLDFINRFHVTFVQDTFWYNQPTIQTFPVYCHFLMLLYSYSRFPSPIHSPPQSLFLASLPPFLAPFLSCLTTFSLNVYCFPLLVYLQMLLAIV